jgi:hypothetical protein
MKPIQKSPTNFGLNAIPKSAISRLFNGLLSLADAQSYAQMLAQDPWEFALRVTELRSFGLTSADFRWLLHAGYILVCPRTKPVARNGSARNHKIVIKDEWLVILRDDAGDEVRRCMGAFTNRTGGGQKRRIRRQDSISPSMRIRYEAERRELFVGKQLVKRFPATARNQAAILEGFQNDSWQMRIANPMRATAGKSRAQQLRDAVHDLNVGQKPRRLRFHSDEKGRSVWWEFISAH